LKRLTFGVDSCIKDLHFFGMQDKEAGIFDAKRKEAAPDVII
jgi:hypothetical protein